MPVMSLRDPFGRGVVLAVYVYMYLKDIHKNINYLKMVRREKVDLLCHEHDN